MSDRIEVPPNLSGDEQQQLQQMWRYLYQLSEALNNNLQAIGGNDLTDDERKIMQKVIGEGAEQGMSEMETLKSLIIKTADFVQTSLNEYSLHLIGSSVASGQFGKYVRNTKLDVAVNPEGITQKYKFQEVVQGLKTFSINAKNYIKTGLLRTVNNVPVYGVAIGKDVVTFDENGNETYVDGNKVAELTAEELSFWQNGVKIAGYTGSRISFYYNGTEVFYISQGKLYAAQDLIIGAGKIITIGNWEFNDEGINLKGTVEGAPQFKTVFSIRNRNDPVDSEDFGACGIAYDQDAYYTPIATYLPRIIFYAYKNEWGQRDLNEYGFEFQGGSFDFKPFTGNPRASFSNVSSIQSSYDGNGGNNTIIGHYTAPFGSAYIEEIRGGIIPRIGAQPSDMDDLKKSGKYYITFGSIANQPTGLSGQYEVDVTRLDIQLNWQDFSQRIYTPGAIYSRMMQSGTWSSWYKFTGTAV